MADVTDAWPPAGPQGPVGRVLESQGGATPIPLIGASRAQLVHRARNFASATRNRRDWRYSDECLRWYRLRFRLWRGRVAVKV